MMFEADDGLIIERGEPEWFCPKCDSEDIVIFSDRVGACANCDGLV
mgnify:CR=1 FL=1